MNIEARAKRIDQVPKEVLELFRNVSNFVLGKARFTAWDEEKMKARWRGRPLMHILKDPEVNHVLPCLDTAMLAAYFLGYQGRNGSFVVLTEKEGVDYFRKNKRARIMHIDGAAAVEHEGRKYLLNIGCGDITIAWPNEKREGLSEEESFYTSTSHEEGAHTWRRSTLIEVPARVLLENIRLSPWDLVDAGKSVVPVPYGITREEFYTCWTYPGKEDLMKENREMYDPKGYREWEEIWREANQEFFPGLHKFVYEDK